MKQKVSVIEINGSTYLGIPPSLKEHLGLKTGKDTAVIEDKEKQHGRYAVFWGVDSDEAEKKRSQ